MQLKCAIAFFGIPRNSNICFPSIQSFIYGSIPEGVEIRSFYHLYQQEKITNPRSSENTILLPENYLPFSNMEGVLERPGQALAQWNYKSIVLNGDPWGDEGKSLQNLIHQLHSLRQVTLQIKNSSYNPDWVFYIRPDLLYHNMVSRYVFESLKNSPGAVYIPGWQWWKGLNDRFAICGSHSYITYGTRIEAIPMYL